MPEICRVCGETYGVVHSCPGAPPAVEPSNWIAPGGFAPLYYFRQALAIARLFDDEAIVQASRDGTALLYGTVIWSIGCLGMVIPKVGELFFRTEPANWIEVAMASVGFAIGCVVFLVLLAAVQVGHWGLTHLLARWWFGARGSFIGILRAMSMGSIVGWLFWIPAVGVLIGGLWGAAVLMRVFEEVDGIGRVKAFGLAFGSGLLWQGFFFFLLLTIPRNQ